MNRSLQRFSLKSLYNGLGIFIFIFSQWAYAQCPTVTNASQSFCNTETPTIANLNAINNGGGVAWFSSTTSTTPLSSGAGLVNGATYYADNAAGNCGTRQPVTVTIYAAPTGQNFQGVCVDNPLEATIANLIANGNNIRWYTTPSGGTPLPSTTVLTDNTIYYASQTNPDTGCETSRLAVFVNVGVVPVPTGPAVQSFCLSPGNTPTVANLQASGLNNWYATVSSAVVLDPATPLINGETYYATTVDPPCESVNRLEITVQLLPPTDAGTDGTLALCSNALTVNPNRNLFSILGGTPQTTGTWSGPLPTSNGHLGTININTLTATGSPYVFTYTVTNAACPLDTATVTITVSNPVNAGNDASLTVCSNNPSFNLFPLLGTTAQAGGVWSPPLASGTGVFNPAIDSSGTYTYTVTGPNACGNDTAIVTVIVNTAANAGTSANTTVCALGPSVNLFTILGGTPQSGGVWSPALASGTGVFNPLVDPPGTYTYTVTGIPPCTNASANVTVTLTPGITPVFTQRPPICQGATLTALPTTSNNGITGTWSPALNNTATTTYTFTPTAGQCATTATMTITVNPNIVPTFTQVPPICQGATLTALPTTSNNGITGTWSPALNNTATTTYTFTPTAGQCANTATMTITVNPNIVPTFTQVPPICQGATLTALPTTSNNGITGTWSPALNNTATTTYTFTPTAGQCATTATMTITVNPNIVPTFTQVPPICQGATLTALPTTSNNGITGTWSPALNNTTTTTYTFTPTAGQCATTATMTITVNPNIVPTFTQVPPVCQGATLTALPTTSNNGITGTWSPALNNTATTTYTFTPTAGQCATTATMTITVNPNIVPTFTQVPPICQGATLTALPTTSNNGITGTWSPALNNTATTTYTFTPTAGQCATTATMTITVNPNIVPTFTQVPPICQGATLTALPTTSNNGITGTWSPALNNTTTTTYTFTPTAGQCATTATMTITVNPNIVPTFTQVPPVCQGATLTALPTTSNNGITGTWSPALNNTATTTYTFTPTAGQCATTATMTITVNPNIVPTFTQVPPICQGATLTALPTTSNNGITGTWSPALNNTATTTYTFTPTAGQCATTATMTITVNPNIVPTFTQVSPICQGATLTALPTTSNNGITGTWSPALNNTATTTYTFTPTAGQCATTATMTITVNPNIVPTFTQVPPICQGATLTALPTTSNNGITGTWSPALNNTATTTYTFTPTAGQCATTTTMTITVNPNIVPTFTQVPPICQGATLTALPTTSNNGITGTWSPALNNTATTTYTFTPTAGQCATTATMTITVNPNIVPTFTQVPPICQGATLTALPTTSNNGISGTWSPALNNTTTTTYTFTPTAGQCATTTTMTITVNPNIVPTFTQVPPICQGTTLTALPTTSNNGITGTWSPALNNTATTTYTFTPSSNLNCEVAITMTITIVPQPNAGNDGTLVLCSNATPTDLFLSLGGTPQAGGTWTPALASGTGFFNPAVDTAGTYIYTVVGGAPCGSDTATVSVSITPAPNAGTDGAATFCADSAPADLFTFLGGTPQAGGTWTPALASGTGVFNPAVDTAGVYTYTVTGTAPCANGTASATVTVNPIPNAGNDGTLVLCSNAIPTDLFLSLGGTPQAGGTWTPALASGTGFFNPAVDTAGTYIYTVVGGAPCGSDTATVSVSITPAPNAGTDGAATFCADSAPADLFTFLGGTPQAGGTWTPALASGTGVFNPAVDTAGVYTYTVTGTAPCANGTASATVTVNPIPNAGNDGTLVLCSNATPTDLFLSLGGTPQAGGAWTPALASGTGFFNPAVDTAGTYIYTVVGGAPCGSDTATVSVSITPAPNAGTDGAATFCADSAPADLFTFLGGTPQAGGTWTPALASGTGVFNPAVDTAGVYTYTVTGTAPCANGTASATVTVNPIPNAGNDGTLVLCSNATPTDLFLSLGGTPQAGGTWTPALASGTGLFNPAVDTAGTYTYTVVGGAPCGSDTATVSVTLTAGPNAGVDATLTLCSNATPIDLFLSLGSSAQSGGAWSPPLASGTGIFNPAFDPAGTYIYTVAGTGTCNPDTAALTVNLIAPPDFGSGTITAPNVCQNSAVIVAISGATTLANGNYTFTYSVTNANPSTGTTAIVLITGGNGQFTIPASYFQTSGNVTIALTSVTALNGNCNSAISTASTTITVLPQPTLSNATILVASLCLGEQATVTITGATGLTNGNYTLDYQLSGVNTGTFSSSVIFTNGAASFTIPASDLTNAGSVNLTLTSIISQITTCGNSTLNFTPITFEVQDPQPPVLTGSTTFCNDSNATLSDLSAQLSGSGTIVWYSSASGGTPLDPTTVVQDGITYYGAVQSSAGCESTRLELTVVLESCTPDDIIIPDGFSPNTDGVNDEFIIKNLLELYPNFTLEIFNRYGNVLFKGNRSNPHWNGRSTEGSVGGGIAPVGVYFFILEFNDGVRAPIQGRLYLSR